MPPVPFEGLATSNLTVGRVYRGGPQPHVGADPLHYLTGVGNSGGFRVRSIKGRPVLCVLFSTGAVTEWPDGWDEKGNYVYYGDQRVPGKELHDTPRRGNALLADVAALVSGGAEGRRQVPPFLLFEKYGPGRDVQFTGLLAPSPYSNWLTAERRDVDGGTLVNYRATFRRSPVEEIPREWLTEVLSGVSDGPAAPAAWLEWIVSGRVE